MKFNFTVNFYEKPDGECPVEDFIKAQPLKMRVKIARMLDLLEEKGNLLRMPYSEHLGDGIFQIRTQIGNDITRILYFFVIGREIILTNGFVKKTPETPVGEIELAKQYRAEYFKRMEEE